MSPNSPYRLSRRGTLAAAGVFAAAFTQARRAHANTHAITAIVQPDHAASEAYIERAFDNGERIGMFQSGWTGYHTRGAVINLDGVVNPHALDAIIGRRLDRYLDERHISLIIDWPWVAEGIVRSRSDASRVLLRAIHDDGYFTVYRYRSRDPAAGQAAP